MLSPSMVQARQLHVWRSVAIRELTTEHFVIIQQTELVRGADLRGLGRRAEGAYRHLRTILRLPECDAPVRVEVLEESGGISGSAEGIAITPRYVCAGRGHQVFKHELIHVLTARSWGYANACLREGLAYHLTRTGGLSYRPHAPSAPEHRASGEVSIARYRGWRNDWVFLAASDGQLPRLAELQLPQYFWALNRFARTDLDRYVSVSAAASFTEHLLNQHTFDQYRTLYRALGEHLGSAPASWLTEPIERIFHETLGTCLDAVMQSWLRFAEHRGTRDGLVQSHYHELRQRAGQLSRPGSEANCWVCGHWWREHERKCPACGGSRRGRSEAALCRCGVCRNGEVNEP